MPRFPVTEAKERALLEAMAAAGIRDDDLDESFLRSPGPGGQHVNKASTAVRLVHVPSGIEVKVSTSRSQGLNRFLARRLLLERYQSEVLLVATKRQKVAAKAKKQKARRSRRRRNRSDAE